ELAAYVGISETSLSLFKSGRLKGIRFHNLEKMCEFLECQPGDILEYTPGPRSEDDGSGTEVPPSPE
ncbi:MAG: helix-turn-helix transcriptional regulator, partial [Myxococcota bacterium]